MLKPCNTDQKQEITRIVKTLFDRCYHICYTQPLRNRSNFINKYTRLNEAIRATSIRVVDQEGRQLGVMSRQEALQAAKDAGYDLVEISPDADPPVAKIIDWGKYNYQRLKQLQKNKRLAKTSELKQMRFGLKISDHDIAVKLKKVNSFLANGDKVRLCIMYRGRELAHKELGNQLMDKLINELGDNITADQTAQFAGRQLSIVVRSTNAKVKNS